MTARCHVNDNELVRDLLLSECDEDATRKSRERMVVQLETHGCLPLKTTFDASNLTARPA